MVEILKRKIKADHQILRDDRIQFSINSYGHLTIRYFKRAPLGTAKAQETEDEDTLIVLESSATIKLMDFLRALPRWTRTDY